MPYTPPPLNKIDFELEAYTPAEIEASLEAIKGLGFKTEEDALRVIRQLAEAAGRGGASFSV